MMPAAEDAPERQDSTAELTVTSFHRGPLGGGILIGRDEGGILRRAVVPAATLGREPQPGEAWRITGPERADTEYGLQIHARVALPLMPSGRAILRYLATNRRFSGVGWATATRLWEALGGGLPDAIKRRDAAALAAVIGAERAIGIIQGFGLLSEEVEVFQWLDRYGVDARTAGAAALLWGAQAIPRIQADPYTLALLEPWRSVDERALRLGVSLTDRRRLLAAVEEALARRLRLGHTAAARGQLEAQLRPILGPHAAPLAGQAIDLAVEAGRVVLHPDGLLQSRAVWFMEREVERRFRERLARESLVPPAEAFEAAIRAVENAESYRLAPRQREAVYMAVSSPLSVICGGAGTGKTTVVKAILEASARRGDACGPGQRSDFAYPQIALAGRAAKRIAEATGREAATIARFLRQLESGARSLKRGMVVFDESSMLDLPSVYRVLVALPPAVDLLFIGDPAQLPPIGPGLLFHRMVEADAIPRVRLDVIHRQAAGSGIPTIAHAIRNGCLPDLPEFDPDHPMTPGVFIAPASGAAVGAAVVDVFRAMAGPPPPAMGAEALHGRDIQILCPTKNGPAGSKVLNRIIERTYMGNQQPIHDWGLSVGSKVIWLKNDYAKAPVRDAKGNPVIRTDTGEPICAGFMNGALGVITEATPAGAWVEFDDGAADELRAYDLEKLTHGWAISVHKAQGSAFRRVIVPVTPSRLLDRAMIYTAVTRAIETVVLVGDRPTLRGAVEAPAKAFARLTTLSFDGLVEE